MKPRQAINQRALLIRTCSREMHELQIGNDEAIRLVVRCYTEGDQTEVSSKSS